MDTNALLLPFERSINIDAQLRLLLGECQVFVPGPIVGELKRSDNKNAPAALRLLSRYTIEDTEGTGDRAVIELAERLGAYVVTNDRALIGKLRQRRIRTILLRGGNHLALDDG